MDIPQRASRQASFTAAEKWALVHEYDKCLDRGSKVAFYRAVGVNSKTVMKWVEAREEGRLVDPNGDRPAVPPRSRMSVLERRDFQLLQRENTALKLKLEQSAATVDILKKASALLDSLAKSATMPKIEDVPQRDDGWPDWLKPKNDDKP